MTSTMAYIGGQSPDPHEGTIHDIFTDLGVDLSTLHIEAVDGANINWNTPVDGLRFKYSLFNVRGINAAGAVATGSGLPFIPGTTAELVINAVWDNIISVEYQRENLTLAAEAEYWYLKGEIRGNAGIPIAFPTYQVMRACYLSASWRFSPRWEAQGIWQWNETDAVTQPEEKFYGFTAALRFDPIEHWLIKAEYTWLHGTSLLRLAEQPDGVLDPVWGYLAIKTTFDF